MRRPVALPLETSTQWMDNCNAASTLMILLGNFPYPGTSDGFSSRHVEAMSKSLGGERAKRIRLMTLVWVKSEPFPTKRCGGDEMNEMLGRNDPQKTSGGLIRINSYNDSMTNTSALFMFHVLLGFRLLLPTAKTIHPFYGKQTSTRKLSSPISLALTTLTLHINGWYVCTLCNTRRMNV